MTSLNSDNPASRSSLCRCPSAEAPGNQRVKSNPAAVLGARTRKNEDVSWDSCSSEGGETDNKENREGSGNKWWLAVSEKGIFKPGARQL